MFAGEVALVTGGYQGIGRAIALDLARHGARVAVIDIQPAKRAAALLDEISTLGSRALAIQSDVTSFTAAGKVIAQVMDKFGQLDIVVSNAGINRDSVVWKMSEEQWDQVISVDLKGVFNYIRAVAPIFKAQSSGKIVNITSINGLRGKFGQANYSAAKGGVVALTKTVARELGRFNVNVNAVAPGLVETEMIRNAPESVREAALQEILLGRLGQPEDIAAAVTFLCSPRARHITGQVFAVDGGQYL